MLEVLTLWVLLTAEGEKIGEYQTIQDCMTAGGFHQSMPEDQWPECRAGGDGFQIIVMPDQIFNF